MIHGVPVGQRLMAEQQDPPPGSVMVILATDAPLDARQLTRLSRRGAMGLSRLGASAANGSGDFILGFSTQNRLAHEPDGWVESTSLLRDDSPAMDRLFLAAVEAVEESVINALWCAQSVEGRDRRIIDGLPVHRVLDMLNEQGRP
jgi:D-aminopeptidase